MIVAVDGPAGSGKSTVCRELAKRLGFDYVDTGSMYRALALAALRKKISPDETQALVGLVRNLPLTIRTLPSGRSQVRLAEEDVSEAIRQPEVDQIVSLIARILEVRKAMVRQQRAVGKQGYLVMEGRDITTVVLPGADHKFYLDARIKTRAERRCKELTAAGYGVSENEIEEDLAKRDGLDRSRSVSPLKLAEDAFRIDTTDLTVGEVIAQMLARINTGKERFNPFYAFSRGLLWLLCTPYFRLRVRGAEKLPKRGGFILASNHRSFLDPVIVAVGSRRQVSFMARDTLFRNPLFARLVRALNAHPLRRGYADRNALWLAIRLLVSGNPVLMFPEGTRSADGKFLEPKHGLGFVVARLGCPVVPVYIKGSYEAFPRHARVIKPRPISVVFGEPIFFAPIVDQKGGKSSYLIASKRVMESIERLSKTL